MKAFFYTVGILAVIVMAGIVLHALIGAFFDGVVAAVPVILKYVLLPAAVSTVAFLVIRTVWIIVRNISTGRIHTSRAWSEIGKSMMWIVYVIYAVTPIAVLFLIIRFSPLGVLTIPVAFVGGGIAFTIVWYLVVGIGRLSLILGRAIRRGFSGS
ncbi:MAG: hypothetical protein IPK97_13570 [Ahniella sp.]|nr:hypothetical protein [Ahniella sp.]